jgi:hypothetical protein
MINVLNQSVNFSEIEIQRQSAKSDEDNSIISERALLIPSSDEEEMEAEIE